MYTHEFVLCNEMIRIVFTGEQYNLTNQLVKILFICNAKIIVQFTR